MPLDDELQNPNNNQPRQGQQGDFGNDSVDKGSDTENDGDIETGNDLVGSVLTDDDSPAGQNVASENDQDFSGNVEAEEDPEANRQEQSAT